MRSVVVCVVLLVLVACTQQVPAKQAAGPSQVGPGPMSTGAPAVAQTPPAQAAVPNATQPLDLSDNLDASIADMEYWVKT